MVSCFSFFFFLFFCKFYTREKYTYPFPYLEIKTQKYARLIRFLQFSFISFFYYINEKNEKVVPFTRNK